ncbi:MAG: DUF4214 domain-containing protein [Clostridia bacterium]|nr:DUF4214 domain-containing protein [Clostridia bacterium]
MNFKRLVARVLATSIILPVLTFALPTESMADSYVAITENNFPDINFRTYVAQFDTNGDDKLSDAELKAVKSINVSNENHKISWGAGAGTVVLNSDAKEIKDLKGIEHFTEIETLNISCNPNLTSVNLYFNTKLKKIVAHNTGLKALSIFRLSSLTDIRIWNTNISGLDLSNSPGITYLDISFTEVNYLDVVNNPHLKNLVSSNNPYTKSWSGKEYYQYLSDGITLNTNKGAVIVSEISSSPDGCSLLAQMTGSYYSNSHTFRVIDNSTLKVFEYTSIKIKISNVIIPEGKSITAEIKWNDKVVNFKITPSTSSIEITRELLDELEPEIIHGYLRGHFDITIKTNSGNVLYDFDLDAFSGADYIMRLANTYLDTGKYYFDTDTITVYVPPEYRSIVSSYTMSDSWYDTYNTIFLTGDYNGGEYINIVVPKEYRVNGYASATSLRDCIVVLYDSDGFTLTKLYPTIYNSSEPNLYIDSSSGCNATIDENGIYHVTDVETIPFKSPLSYDNYRTELYYNDRPIGYSYYAYIGSIVYGTEAAVETHHFAYDTYNGYLYPGTYHIKIWAQGINYLTADLTVEVSVTGFDPSTAPEPDLPTVEIPVITTTPTSTPGNTPTPSGTPSSTPATPGANNGGSQNGSGNSNGGSNNVTPSTTPGTSSQTPTPAIPTVAPTPTPELSIGDFVKRCYNVALGREPDEGGFNYWVDNLNNGSACGAQVGYGFIFSQEYINKNRTNEEFVTDLYSMYFGRTPDSEGFKYWVDKLNAGEDRENIFAGFANSLEFYNLCTKYGVVQGLYIVGVPNDIQGGVNCFVARMYSVCLNRLPDMEGQSGWVLKLMNGEVTGTSLSYGFVFSPEFIGNNPSKGEFVACMYRAFFGREPDQDGFNSWVSVLAFGGSYEDVFNGFTGSLEFANLCNSYGINP